MCFTIQGTINGSHLLNHEREFAIYYCSIRTVVQDIRKALCFREFVDFGFLGFVLITFPRSAKLFARGSVTMLYMSRTL